MKQLTIIIHTFICLFLFNTAMAQYTMGFKIGARATSLMATSNTPGVELVPFSTFTLGGIIEKEASKHVSWIGELNFTQRGYAFEITEAGNTSDKIEFEQRINYVDLPLLVKFRLEGNTLGAYLSTGLSLGVATTTDLKLRYLQDGEVIESFEENDAEIDEEAYETINTAALLGLGLTFKIGKAKLFTDLRMDFGLNSIITNEDLKAFGADFNVGLLFPIGAK